MPPKMRIDLVLDAELGRSEHLPPYSDLRYTASPLRALT